MKFSPEKSITDYEQEVDKIQRKVNALGLSPRDRQIALNKELEARWPGVNFGIKIPPEKAAEIKKKIEKTTVHDLAYHEARVALAQERVAHLSGEERRVKLEEILSGMYGVKIAVPESAIAEKAEIKKTPETKKVEAKKTKIKELSDYENEIGDLQKKVAHLSEPERSKKLGELLEKKYGFDFGLYEKKAEGVIEEIKNTEPEKQEEKLEEILESKAPRVEKSKIKEIIRKIMPKAGIAFAIGAPVILAAFLLLNKAGNGESATEKEKIDNKDGKEKNTPPTVGIPDSTKFTPSPEPIDGEPLFPERKFDQNTYESLPMAGQEIYKRHFENDPTPGRAYLIADKKGGKLFIIGPDNILIKAIKFGHGKDAGDAKNLKEGGLDIRTTPSGTYLLGEPDANLVGLADEYGGQLFNVYGYTVHGEQETIVAIHEIWRKEFASRSKKLADNDPMNDNFSNGCINVFPEDFAQYIKPYFKGDFDEMLYILQDEAGERSGTKFNIDKQLHMMAPLMIKMAEEEVIWYQNTIKEIDGQIRTLEQDLALLEKNKAPSNDIEAKKKDLEEKRTAKKETEKEGKRIQIRMEKAKASFAKKFV